MKKERIQKIIANAGFCSRRKAEELIAKNFVLCNGKTVKLGDKATFKDSIYVNNKKINFENNSEKIYVVLNKPKGFVTTMQDEKGRKTVADLAKKQYEERLFPVGRLDCNSQGLIILTNDGEFANFVMHPSSNIYKTYKVTIPCKIAENDAKKLENGVFLNSQKTAKTKVEILKSYDEISTFLIRMHEGKKRQIREMVKKVFNCNVIKLVRIKIGIIKLNNLKPGKMRPLTKHELNFFRNLQKNKKN